ncbi:MAG: hypothetical protein WCH76_01610 [Candidatus Riflemargulisbacteria bacterium]
MDIASIKRGAADVSKYFFEEGKGQLDDDLTHLSTDEVRYALKFKSDDLSSEAKTFLEGILYRNAYVVVKNLHKDAVDGISLDDLKVISNLNDIAKIEKAFEPLSEISILENSKDYPLTTGNAVHDFEVISVGQNRKIIYVAKGLDGLSPTGFWIGDLKPEVSTEYVSLEGKKVNNSDFCGLDAREENGKIMIDILNRPSSSIVIKKITNVLYEFNLGGMGQADINHIIVYDKESEKKNYADLPRKFFIHISEKTRYFNVNGRLVAISLNANRKPTVSLPLSLEEISIKPEEFKQFFWEEKLEHTALTDDGVMMGISSFPGATQEKLATIKMLVSANPNSIVRTEKGIYMFGDILDVQKIFFLDKTGELSLLDKGNKFSSNFGVQDATIMATTSYKDKIVLLIQNTDRKDELSVRNYYVATIKEEDLTNGSDWELSPKKLVLKSISSDASIRSISVDKGKLYLLSDDPARKIKGTQQHVVHEINPSVSKLILGD